MDEARVVSAGREIAAGADTVFALIADPAEQPDAEPYKGGHASVLGRRTSAVARNTPTSPTPMLTST